MDSLGYLITKFFQKN